MIPINKKGKLAENRVVSNVRISFRLKACLKVFGKFMVQEEAKEFFLKKSNFQANILELLETRKNPRLGNRDRDRDLTPRLETETRN